MKVIHRALGTMTALLAFSTQAASNCPVCAQSQDQKSDAPSVVTVVGVLKPQVLVDIAPTGDGRLQSISPTGESGAVVKKGGVLAQIDPARYQAEAAMAKAQLEQAEAELLVAKAKVALAARELEKRSKAHEKVADAADIAISEAAFAVAKATVVAKEAHVGYRRAALSRAEANLEACTIRSPIDGVTIDRRVNVGQIVSASASAPSPFLIGSDLTKLDIWATVPEADIGRIAKGQAASFTVTAFPNRRFKAAVKQIRLNAAPQNNQVTYTVVLDVENTGGRLLPYMSAKVTIEVGQRH